MDNTQPIIIKRVKKVAGGAALGIGVAARPAQDITFRVTTDTITVDVSVIVDGRPVTDLTVDDFVLTDSGRPQKITSLSRETLPIDVTCIIDLSASVQGPLLDALTRAVDAIGSGLGPSDRARVVSFNQQIRQVRPLEAGWPADLSLGTPGSLTSLFDAVTVALIAPAEIGRRRMAIVFTDGLDTTSFLDGSQLLEIARRSNMAVFTS